TGLKGDPPSPAEVERLRRSLRAALAEEVGEAARAPLARLVATSGTAVCAADLADLFASRARQGGGGALREVRTRELSQVAARLAGMKRREIAALPPVGGPRSDSILAGAILLEELVLHAGVDRFQVCDRALREGLVLAALGQPIPLARDPEDLRRRQVLQPAERSESVLAHDLQSARLAVRLFDLTLSVHGLGPREREWLEYAALLHPPPSATRPTTTATTSTATTSSPTPPWTPSIRGRSRSSPTSPATTGEAAPGPTATRPSRRSSPGSSG